MRDVRGNARIGQEVSALAARPAIGLVLDNFYGVPIGIGDVEFRISNFARADFIGNLDALRCEIGAHAFGGIGIESDVT